MSAVTRAEIDSAWQQVNEFAGAGRVQELLEQFNGEQPQLSSFVFEAAQNLGGDAADLVIHAALVVWGACHGVREVEATPLEAEAIYEGFGEAKRWLEALEGKSGDAVLVQKKISDFSRYEEPALMEYAIEAVFEGHEDGLELEPDEQSIAFLVLKTLVDLLSAPLRPSRA